MSDIIDTLINRSACPARAHGMAPQVDTDLVFKGPDLFTCVTSFWEHLSQYDYLDVCTYSLGRVPKLPPVKRLIYHTCGFGVPSRLIADEARRADHFHAKIYLGWNGGRCVAGFVGSLNLIPTRSVEIMVRVARHAALRKWFDQAWESIN